jgi:hypothetical protein
MAVTVTPAEFTYVTFDAGTIEDLLTVLMARLDMGGRSLQVDVNEASPVVRIVVEDGEPIVLRADSGAFEDPRRPRALSDESVVTNAGRVLLRVRDRGDGSFAEAPPDSDLTLAEMAAWDTYAVGRLGRLGYRVYEPRWRYNFRNRHGFTDISDAVFDRIWAAERLTWSDLSAASEDAAASTVATP